jgi:molybdopterin synthase sulfur carrier subunit
MMLSYFGSLRDVTHKPSEQWTRPAATLGDLLKDLIAAYGPTFGRWVLPDGVHLGTAVILIDSEDARSLRQLETPLKADSEVTIFPPLGGG